MQVYRSAQHFRLQSPVSSDKISKFTSFHSGSLGQNRAQHVMMATMEKPQQDNAKQHLRLPHRLTCWVCQRGYTTQLFNLSPFRENIREHGDWPSNSGCQMFKRQTTQYLWTHIHETSVIHFGNHLRQPCNKDLHAKHLNHGHGNCGRKFPLPSLFLR